MNSKYHNISRILVLIPIIVFVVTIICWVLASMLEAPTHRGTIYSIFAMVGLIGIFLAPLPCLIISVLGTIFAVKSVKDGSKPSRKYLFLGILEILANIWGGLVAVVLFIGSMSV
ncbi:MULTISPECIES: hypothetical protein [unclassified Butyrivibrio]|uniref:hypothetical protein n=1 Tax=unclassified Butyrivibrio TaxID=2639466 RepID=UPI0003B70595|nr:MULTISPECIES: hypothetical protein [unclassified Butyrivibrio]SEM53079.1 hypothetical protein SAMN04487770_1449 [Butyrivibrio sp. ob235]